MIVIGYHIREKKDMGNTTAGPTATPTAAVIIIGSEILSGRTEDKNLNYIAKALSVMGIRLVEARFVDDIETHIIEAVCTLSDRHTYVFTTGGIGGTHDDITAASVAKAFDLPLTYNPKALAALEEYYGSRLNEARKRMALTPEGATLIPNPVSVAPGFKIKNVYVMAGIPTVMQVMMDYLNPLLKTGTPIIQKTIVCNVAEGDIADPLAAIQKENPDVEIGSYPSFYQGKLSLNLVVRGVDAKAIDQAVREIQEIVQPSVLLKEITH